MKAAKNQFARYESPLLSEEAVRARSTPVTVLGAGAWGTALAMQLARQGQEVRLWTRDAKHAETMINTRCNARYLPVDFTFPDTISVYSDLKAALAGVMDSVIVVPSHAFCELLTQIKPYLASEARIIWGIKGFPVLQHQDLKVDATHGKVKFLHHAAHDILGSDVDLAVLSGPSFAVEVAEGLPTAVVVASKTQAVSTHWLHRFRSRLFRVYPSDDRVGVEMGGILKNIIAVAVGVAAGFGCGDNARSALITRGLAEIQRLGEVLGARPETLTGLAGLGDLVLTSTSDKSRNYRLGFALGSGLSLDEAKQAAGNVIESVHNVEVVYALAEAHRIDLPIMTQVKQLICDGWTVGDAAQSLLAR